MLLLGCLLGCRCGDTKMVGVPGSTRSVRARPAAVVCEHRQQLQGNGFQFAPKGTYPTPLPGRGHFEPGGPFSEFFFFLALKMLVAESDLTLGNESLRFRNVSEDVLASEKPPGGLEDACWRFPKRGVELPGGFPGGWRNQI